MPLRNIIADVAATFGIEAVSERDFVISQINSAAEELYESTDLVGSLLEQVFLLPSGEDQVSLPSYVKEVRAARRPKYGDVITLTDLRPRFHLGGWGQVGYDKWRLKGTSPLQRELPAELPLRLKAVSPLSTAIVVAVTGRTSSATRATEETTLTDEETQAKVFSEIYTIAKSDVCDNDILVFCGDTQVSMIPNCETSAQFQMVQVEDDCLTNCTYETTCTECLCVEILFKQKLYPFKNDYDEFPCPGYDNAIVAKFGELYSKTDKESYAQKCAQLLAQRQRTQEYGKEMKFGFGHNRFLNAYRYASSIPTQRYIYWRNASCSCR